MKHTDIAVEVKTFLETEFPNAGVELTDDTNLIEDWFADSLALTEVVVFAEERFGITLTGADFTAANFRDVASISRLIESRLGG